VAIAPDNKARTVFTVQVTKTRDSNTDAYTTDEVINESASTGTIWTYEDIVPENGQTG